jgi:hypothetical protein
MSNVLKTVKLNAMNATNCHYYYSAIQISDHIDQIKPQF